MERGCTHPLFLHPPPFSLAGRGSFLREGGDTLHVVHICCRRGWGARQALGKDRRRALHAEPSHPIPQIEGNNQKNYQTTKTPYNRLRPQSRLNEWWCVLGGRGGRGSEKGLCLRAVLVATGPWGRIPRPGPQTPLCTRTHTLPFLCELRLQGVEVLA